MSEVSKENIAAVTGALEEYLQRIVQTTQFNLQEFVNFMEPKFAAAGYRETPRVNEKNNILILSDDAVGDFILTTGAIREIRRLYPEEHIVLVGNPRTIAIAELCPYVDEIILNAKNFVHRDFPGVFRSNINVARQLLERRFDICFAFIYHTDTPLLAYMSGARVRIMRDYANDKEDVDAVYGAIPLKYLTHLATDRVSLNDTFGRHMADFAFSLVDYILHAPVVNRSLEVWNTAFEISDAERFVEKFSKPVYALCMGGSGPHRHHKHYPPEKYAELLKMIAAEEPTATFVILGGGAIDSEGLEMIQRALDKDFFDRHIVNLVNKATYRQSAAVLRFCSMYIGTDTGTMHFAVAVGCPVINPNCFPADLPQEYTAFSKSFRPYGVPSCIIQPAHALPECAVNEPNLNPGCRLPKPHCITQITPEKIFEGFHLLKQRIAENNTETLYIH